MKINSLWHGLFQISLVGAGSDTQQWQRRRKNAFKINGTWHAFIAKNPRLKLTKKPFEINGRRHDSALRQRKDVENQRSLARLYSDLAHL